MYPPTTVGAPQPTFAGFRTQITNRTIDSAFRAGWIGDYPSMIEFLAPLYATGAGSNDVGYASPEFDAALQAAQRAPSRAPHATQNRAPGGLSC